jgi:hypothetical protein
MLERCLGGPPLLELTVPMPPRPLLLPPPPRLIIVDRDGVNDEVALWVVDEIDDGTSTSVIVGNVAGGMMEGRVVGGVVGVMREGPVVDEGGE